MDNNNSLYNESIERADFFRRIQAWPLNDVLNYRGWLNNFSTSEEKDIASNILKFFIFYPDAMINQMLKAVIGYCGEYLANRFPDWQHNDFKNRCIYTFIPGETINPTDSGHIYLRKLRDSLGIPQERIVDYPLLYPCLESLNKATPIIFVDDFVGSGAQCNNAWNVNKGGRGNCTLNEIASKTNHIFIYASLVANHLGYNRIKQKCRGLELVTCHILNAEYNLFDSSCICWNNDSELYIKGISLILNKSREQGIPFTCGKKEIDVKGFDNQGLALAFANGGVPDAIPAFFYWCSDTWTPLIKKEYKR
jgi:hypothetical protein